MTAHPLHYIKEKYKDRLDWLCFPTQTITITIPPINLASWPHRKVKYGMQPKCWNILALSQKEKEKALTRGKANHVLQKLDYSPTLQGLLLVTPVFYSTNWQLATLLQTSVYRFNPSTYSVEDEPNFEKCEDFSRCFAHFYRSSRIFKTITNCHNF